jgi:hypothetical protein
MNKYRLYNETQGIFEFVNSSEIPTESPSNASDTVRDVVIVSEVIDLNDGSANVLSLEDLKEIRKQEIDTKTGELISVGYEYPASSGKFFSISANSQSNLHAMRADPASFIGIKWMTKDDSDFHTIVDANDALALYGAAFGMVSTHKMSGAELKIQVTAATTIAEVDAIIDNR